MTVVVAGFAWNPGNRIECERHGVGIAEIAALFQGSRLAVQPDPAHPATEVCVVTGADLSESDLGTFRPTQFAFQAKRALSPAKG